MKIGGATFIKSVAESREFYVSDKPLVAVVGKSNVGKSSLINMLANNRKLARTSDTPGRTRLINYFSFGEFVLADLPGYGFAKVGKEEKAKWAFLMEDFLRTQDIKLLILLTDIRHDPTADDLMMIKYLYHYAIPFIPVATKADKLPKTRIKPNLYAIASKLGVGAGNMLAASAADGTGKEDILAAVEKAIHIGV